MKMVRRFALPRRAFVRVLDVLNLLLRKQTVGPVRGEFFLESLCNDLKLPSGSNAGEDVVKLLWEVFAVFDHVERTERDSLGWRFKELSVS